MLAISFKVIEEIVFFVDACLICIIINETATSGNGNRFSGYMGIDGPEKNMINVSKNPILEKYQKSPGLT